MAEMVERGWRLIDSAPRGETILVTNKLEMGVVFWREGRWHLGGLMYFNKPTHWMPLPSVAGL